MDGVIVDSNPYHKKTLQQFCKSHGFDLSEKDLKEKVYGRTNKDWIPAVFGKLSAEEVKKLGDEKEELFRKEFAAVIRPLDGLLDFLEALKKGGYPCAVATSAPVENANFILDSTGTRAYFSTVLDESDVSKGKPDPEIYLKSCKALGKEPRECVVFEDSLSGVKSAIAAGCKVVGIRTTHSSEELSETHYQMDDFREITPQRLLGIVFP